jgi:sedoheptulokinase
MTYALGLDIGTTSVSALLVACDTGKVVDAASMKHNADIPPTRHGESRQDPTAILETARLLRRQLEERYGPVAAVGVTGQMHGIIYLDASGRAVSSFYSWLDARGEWDAGDGGSYREQMIRALGQAPPSGYGAVTHWVNSARGEVPTDARMLCTPPDWVAMSLAGLSRPVTDPGLAQSLGLFDLTDWQFRHDLWAQIGDGRVAPPEVARAGAALSTAGGAQQAAPGGAGGALSTERDARPVPVTVPTGDNQASFFGAVGERADALLVNVGTSAQVAFRVPGSRAAEVNGRAGGGAVEVRPLPGGDAMVAGSSLSGGKVFQIVGSLLREMGEAAGCEPDVDTLFGTNWPKPDEPRLRIDTRIAGSRDEVGVTGAISGITLENFTVPNLVWGLAEGIVRELHELWRASCTAAGEARTVPAVVIGSGNAVRRSPTLQRALTEWFGVPLEISPFQEDAAYGAAMLAAELAGAATGP